MLNIIATPRHAGHVAGWAQDIGADRKRKAAGRRTFGRHGNGHVGAAESKAEAWAANFFRKLAGKAANGAHGVRYARTV